MVIQRECEKGLIGIVATLKRSHVSYFTSNKTHESVENQKERERERMRGCEGDISEIWLVLFKVVQLTTQPWRMSN